MQILRIFFVGTLGLLTYGGHGMLASGQQRQHFRKLPKDQHVVEGKVAIIKCEVGNQAGRVQWAKDGFVLGFNRSIPGYPRYEMVGDGVGGEHHLRIHNTTLMDDADYQCQVGPADGHPPIRATGHLTVLMAPSSVELVGRGREQVIEVNEGEEVTLECRVEDAKPVANVRWYKNDQEIHLDSRQDETEESAQRRRHNLVSRVTLRLTPNDDGSHYACKVQHPALSKPMVAQVKVSVLYPPGSPVITGYTEGETIRAGEERTLTCRSRGGNPLGRVIWYRNNEDIDTTDRPMGIESVNEYKFMVDSTDNGAVYTCEVRNKLTLKPLLASVKLNVEFPPEKVIVSGPSQSRVGENVTLTCIVENSNPPAEVSWVVDGQPRNDAKTRQEKAGPGGWHSVSKLSLLVPSVERNMMFTCHATNTALGETKVDTFMLSVLRPPQKPALHGYVEGSGLQTGTRKRITCVSKGGNPPAHLQWYRNGEKIQSEQHSIEDVSSAEIEIIAAPENNGVQYRCEAHNSAAASPISQATTIIVHYPPEGVNITLSPKRMSAGSQAILTCEAGPSNPPATISWIRRGYKLMGRVQETARAPNGGTRVSNVLALNLTAEDDGETYTCRASNVALQRDVTQSVVLQVNYAPTFLSEPPDEVDVVVGDSEVLNLTARANPGPVLYTWTRHGLPLPEPVIDDSWRHAYAMDQDIGGAESGSRVAAVGPLLYIRGVTVEDAGDYELEAVNQEGATIAKVYLNVLYPPTIRYTSEVVTVSEGQDARLECGADGNPLTEAMMMWTRHNYDFARTEQTFGSKKASLAVLRANRNDTGVFTCNVNNGIGKGVKSNVTLIVKSKPQVQHSQLLTRAASELGRTGQLKCLAEGAPDVSFSWRREGVLLSNGVHPDKYKNETVKTGLVTWASTFYIRNVDVLDYGYYECIAENELGASTINVHFSRPTPPDPPIALKVLNTTHDSVTLAWIPGFNGGKPQYFRLRYRTKGSTSYQYLDVYESGVYSYSVTGLSLDTEYFFSIMSYNDIGDSDYKGEFVRATTRSQPIYGERDILLNQVLGGRGDLMKLLIIGVAVFGTVIVIINIALVICLIRRKRRRRRDDEGSEQGSSKSTTNTMYAPSSYNDTVVGETLSSISEKSRESYTQDDSVVDYEGASAFYHHHHLYPSPSAVLLTPTRLVARRGGPFHTPPTGLHLSRGRHYGSSPVFLYDQYDLLYEGRRYEQTHKHAASTYLIDQIEPPPEYASQTPSQPSSAAYDPHEDDYAEVLRRNAYNHQLGKVTPRPPSRATHYSTSPETRGYLSFSYTPSPTGVPNGAAQYHASGPSVTLGIHDHRAYPADVTNLSLEEHHNHALQSLGLDSDPPPSLGLEQHSIPSEHPSLTLDPHSITIDHPVIAVTDFSNRNGDLRVQPPSSLTTFNPNPSPSTFSESDLEGHLV